MYPTDYGGHTQSKWNVFLLTVPTCVLANMWTWRMITESWRWVGYIQTKWMMSAWCCQKCLKLLDIICYFLKIIHSPAHSWIPAGEPENFKSLACGSHLGFDSNSWPFISPISISSLSLLPNTSDGRIHIKSKGPPKCTQNVQNK